MEERHSDQGEPKPDAPTPQDLVIEERRARALALHLAGHSYRAIGKALNVSHQQAFRDVHDATRELAEQKFEQTEQYVAIQYARLNKLLSVVWTGALRGNLDCIDQALNILGKISRLLGIDAPIKVQHEGKVTLEGLFAMANKIESERHGTLFGKPMKLGGPEAS